MLVSIIVPVYKKENTIVKDLTNIYNVMSQTRWKFEIIAVVDGFLDKSYENASTISFDNLHVVGYKENRGKGYAVRYGMARAKGQYVAFIDSGMDIDPNGISLILEHMEWYNADIIVASKRHPASQVNYGLVRRIYSKGYFFIVKLLFGLKVSDTQTGLKVYKREVLEKVLPRLLIKEFAFDIELLAVAHYLGFKRIFEAPVKLKLVLDDSTSKFKFGKGYLLLLDKNMLKMVKDTLAVFYRLYILRYYDDNKERDWVYDENLDMKVNTGE